jgi:hypothetical protein
VSVKLGEVQSDPKYRLRISLLPSKAQIIAFTSIVIIAIFSLASDFIFLRNTLPLPAIFSDRLIWELTIASSSLILILLWLWYAFISPPVLTSNSSNRFFQVIQKIIINGDKQQMGNLADELARSSTSLIKGSYGVEELRRTEDKNINKHRLNCYWILSLLSNARFCHTLALTKSHTLITLLQEVVRQKRFDAPIYSLVENVTTELINTHDSLLYQENKDFARDYLGQAKYLTRILFSEIVEHSRDASPLRISLWKNSHWESQHFGLYLSCALEYAKYATDNKAINYNRTISGLLSDLEHADWDFQSEQYRKDKLYQKNMDQTLWIVIKFIDDLLSLMDEKFPSGTGFVSHKYDALRVSHHSIHYNIAECIYKLMRETGLAINKEDDFHQWCLCHNTVWSLFSRLKKGGPHRRLIAKTLRRMIYKEIHDGVMFPNYVIAPVVGFCLNVCGFELERGHKKTLDHNTIIRYFLVPFIKKNFRSLHMSHTKVTSTMLQGTIYYDSHSNQLIRESAESLNGTKSTETLEIDGPPKGQFY